MPSPIETSMLAVAQLTVPIPQHYDRNFPVGPPPSLQILKSQAFANAISDCTAQPPHLQTGLRRAPLSFRQPDRIVTLWRILGKGYALVLSLPGSPERVRPIVC